MADYKVLITANAQNNLEEILGYLMEQQPEIVRRYYAKLIKAINSLSNFPERGRSLPEYEGEKNIREIFVYKHRIIYEIKDDIVYVLYVWHGMRIFKVEVKS